MPLIEGDHLLQRFSERLANAIQVDIAVAWANPCDALDALYEGVGEGTAIRIAIGVSGNVTFPATLERLQDLQDADLRIAPSPQYGIFHPKYFCFHGPDRTICWVGSANLTRRGFGFNNELVHEFDDSAGEGQRWFESLWNTLIPDPGPQIDDYKKRWKPRRFVPQPPPSGGTPELVPLSNQSTWDDFVEGLKTRDKDCRSQRPYTVLGVTNSYLHTISTGREVARLPNWGNLTQPECYILRGFEREEEEGRWGLLGSLPRGGAPYVFNPVRMPGVGPVRMQIREQVDHVLNAGPSEIAEVAHGAMETIRQLKHVENAYRPIGPAAATRLLTLARPDYLVSVNGKSAAGLGTLSGLKSLADNYGELLNWVYDQPWFNSRQPDDPLEREIWKYRAALLDAFVYEEINGRLQPTR